MPLLSQGKWNLSLWYSWKLHPMSEIIWLPLRMRGSLYVFISYGLYLRIPDLIFHWTVSVSNREPFWLVRWISLSLLQRCSHSWRCLKTSSWVCQPEPRLAAVAKWLQMKNTTESFCNWVLALCTLPCRIVPPRVLLGLVLAPSLNSLRRFFIQP